MGSIGAKQYSGWLGREQGPHATHNIALPSARTLSLSLSPTPMAFSSLLPPSACVRACSGAGEPRNERVGMLAHPHSAACPPRAHSSEDLSHRSEVEVEDLLGLDDGEARAEARNARGRRELEA